MHIKSLYPLLLCLVISVGCQNDTEVSQVDVDQTGNSSDQAGSGSGAASRQKTTLTAQIVEASCGECQFGMDGSGCDLAVRIDGESYYVDGAKIDDHGDAHGDDGMCNCVRQAKVSGEFKGDRFVSTAFELMPIDKEQQQAAKEERLRKSSLGCAMAMSDEGLVIAEILEDGAAGRAGLKKGDKIIKLDGKAVSEMEPDSLRTLIAGAEVVNFSIMRDGEQIEISVAIKKDNVE